MSGFGRAPTEQHSRRLSDCGAAFSAEDPDLVKGRREWTRRVSRRIAQSTRSPKLPNDFDAECPRQDPGDKLPNDFSLKSVMPTEEIGASANGLYTLRSG
jgi:hypothetical protein